MKEMSINSPRSKKKAKKITGLDASKDGKYVCVPFSYYIIGNNISMPYQQLLVTSNDSKVRMYQSGTFELLCTYMGSLNKDFNISGGWR